MSIPAGPDVTVYKQNHARDYKLGQFRDYPDGRRYKFVKCVDDVDVSAGDALEYASTDLTEVTPDVSGGSSIAIAAGVSPIALDVSDDYVYFWMQVRGFNQDAMTTDTNVVVGPVITGSADGKIYPDAGDGTDIEQQLGIATAADSSAAQAASTLWINPRCGGGA